VQEFKGRVAVITGGASGIGWELAKIAAALGMRLVLADIQADALERACAVLAQQGVKVAPFLIDLSKADQAESLASSVRGQFGAPHLLFNNAGVSAGGLIWEHTLQDWEWLLGINLMGVAHGVRLFVPMMLEGAAHDPCYEAHVVNTASMAGLLNAPLLGLYNVSKHAVVSLSESLFQDLALITTQVHAHVLCPYFLPTNISDSERNRPAATRAGSRTRSQQVAQEMSVRAVTRAHTTAAQVAAFVFDAIRSRQFYIYSHPQALGPVRTRCEDLLTPRNPSDPFAERPEVGERMRAALTGQPGDERGRHASTHGSSGGVRP
jgi:NAD(P)-dependent dehydrogenase (short-subunit alcohol dehydrogenase family)